MNKEKILTKLSNISAYITLPSEVDAITIHNELIEVMEYINTNEDKKWTKLGKFYHNCKFDNEEIRDMMDLLEASSYYNDENVELKDDGSWYDLKIAIHKLIVPPSVDKVHEDLQLDNLKVFFNLIAGGSLSREIIRKYAKGYVELIEKHFRGIDSND